MKYRIEANVYVSDDQSESKPGGLTVAFDTEDEMWVFFRKIRDLALPQYAEPKENERKEQG